MKFSAFTGRSTVMVSPDHTRTSRLVTKIMLRMRLTFILLTVVLAASANDGVSQNITFSAANASPEQIMTVVRQQTKFVFLYKEDVLKDAPKITISAKDMPLQDFLKMAFQGQPFTWVIHDQTVVLKSREAPASDQPVNNTDDLFFGYLPITIKGRVMDDAGKPVAGAVVKIKGKKKSVVTDDEGNYEIKGVEAQDILVITAVNIETVETAVNGRKEVNIIGRRKVSALGEVTVQVNTGYQSIPKERATGSFGVVTAQQLSKYPVTSLFERLQGLVPGVDISTATTAGKSRSGTVTIRGLSTIVSDYTKVSTDPLLVIDGFPSATSISAGALNFINPDDVEQVTFLKDAAAASIWGIQAANGVIVITTKKGTRNSKPIINFMSTLGTSKRPRPNYGKMMTTPQYIQLEKELIDKGVMTDPVLNTSSFYPSNNSQAQAILFSFKRGAITADQMNQQLDALGKIDNTDQVSQYLLRPPATHQYNLSISGGGPGSSYFISGYFYTDDRAYKSNDNQGYSIKASNVSSFLNGRVSLTSDLTFGNTKDKINGAAVRAMSITPGGLRVYDQLKDPNGNNNYYDVVTTPQVARGLEKKGYLSFLYSPIDELNYSNTYNTSNNITLNLAANANITSWLAVNLSGNIGRMFTNSNTYWEPNSYDARIMVNSASSINSTGAVVHGIPIGGKLNLMNEQNRSYNLRGQFTINKTWNDLHRLNFLAGAEIRQVYDESSSDIRYGYDKEINSFRTVNPGASYKDMYGNTQTIGPTSSQYVEKTTRSLSYYGNASYSFMNKYIVSGSARLDDNNLLGVDRRKRAVPLWSTGLKWNLKGEEFIKYISWINQLSARATYGFSGNAPQGYAPVTVIDLLGSNYYTGYPYANIGTPAIDNLAWEKTRMINYGIDYSLLGNRIFGSLEYYLKRTTDIIWSMPINATYGYGSLLFNTANLNGKGVDLSLGLVPVQTKTLKWTSIFNLSYNTNIVKDSRFNGPTTSFDAETLYNGYPSDYLFSYAWSGLDKTGQSLIKDPKKPGTTYTVMDYPYEDIRVYSGRSKSPWFGGFNNSVQYKGWELAFQFIYHFGGVFRKPSVSSVGFSNTTLVGRSGDLAERWELPGDEAKTNVPGLIYGPGASYYTSLDRYVNSDYLIRSRSNIRFQQVMLSYSVPQRWLQKASIRSMILSGACRNLGMIWAANKEKLDPDYLYTTGNNYQLSPVASFTFQASINF